MKKKSFILFSIHVYFLLGGVGICEEKKNIYIEGIKKSTDFKSAPTEYSYLNAGPIYSGPLKDGKIDKNFSAYWYRVGFVIHEIYNHITIERLEFDEENEGAPPILRGVYFINGFELSKRLDLLGKGEVITDIAFIKWNSWDQFSVEIHNKKVMFKIVRNIEDDTIQLVILNIKVPD